MGEPIEPAGGIEADAGVRLRRGGKELVVVGDRVLIEVEQGESRTEVGLYLPRTAVERESVQAGRVVAKGPGIPLPPPADALEDEPWKTQAGRRDVRHIPVQAEVGDLAIYLKKAAVEIAFEGKPYVIVPQAGLLALVRDTAAPGR